MAPERSPRSVLEDIKRGNVPPFLLFFGPCQFIMERTVTRVREALVGEGAGEFNFQSFYVEKGDATLASEILEAAGTLPFMHGHRLILVRKTDRFSAKATERFLPYLDDPSPTTCLIFLSETAHFGTKFYKKFREKHATVRFDNPPERQLVPWVLNTARDLGLRMGEETAAMLVQLVGGRLIDLYGELEKLSISHRGEAIGAKEIKALGVAGREYNLFELMDAVSMQRTPESLRILECILAQDRDASFSILGMLNRQLRLLFQARRVWERRGKAQELGKAVGLPPTIARRLLDQAALWPSGAVEEGISLLHWADRELKSGGDGPMVLRYLVLSLCRKTFNPGLGQAC